MSLAQCLASFAITQVCFWAIPASAQLVEICAIETAGEDGHAAEVACLRNAIASLEATQEMQNRALLRLVEDLEAFKTEVAGPEKVLQEIPAVAVFSYSRAVPLFQTTQCAPDHEERSGFVIIGAEVGPESAVSDYSSFCGDWQRCVRGQMYKDVPCLAWPRAAGCYVNVEWLAWHQSRPGASMRIEDICR